MKKLVSLIMLLFVVFFVSKGQDTLYVFKSGKIVEKKAVSDIDSMSFVKPVIDIDGNVYHTVTLGTQTWMVENLRTSRYRDGSAIPYVTDNAAWVALSTGACGNYNNDSGMDLKYGKLYNWYAVADSRIIAPVGWHVPTLAEWSTLENYLIGRGDNYIAKSLSATTDWLTTSTAGAVGNNLLLNNRSGFSALPAGNRSQVDGSFTNFGELAFFWSTSSSGNNATYKYIVNISVSPGQYTNSKNCGISIRCVKD